VAREYLDVPRVDPTARPHAVSMIAKATSPGLADRAASISERISSTVDGFSVAYCQTAGSRDVSKRSAAWPGSSGTNRARPPSNCNSHGTIHG
jgi:hypothetical protein